jgi:hypothetical protein
MSMAAMIGTMAQREADGPPKRAKKDPKNKADAEASEAQSYLGLLVNAIPTELLALYTFVLAAIVATIDGKDDPLETLRWFLFGVTVAIIGAWLVAAYFRRPKSERKRKFPIAEVSAAMVAFAAWGLAMPESPLGIKYSGDDLTVRTVLITAAGVLLLGFITGSMKKPVKPNA